MTDKKDITLFGFDEEICKTLQKPLTPHTRRGPGGNYSYYKGSDVIRRLNEAFGHAWSSHRVDEKIFEDQVLVLVNLTVYTEKGPIEHHGYGSANIARDKRNNTVIDIGNSYKSAFTSALKKAAEQFGIGLGSEDEEDSVLVPPSTQNYPSKAAPGRVPTATRPLPAPPSPLKTPSGAPGRASMPRPEPLSRPAAQNNSAPAPTSKLPTAGQSGEKLNGTQQAAIAKFANMKKCEPTALIRGAGINKESVADLTRDEAVLVIRYANTLPQG